MPSANIDGMPAVCPASCLQENERFSRVPVPSQGLRVRILEEKSSPTPARDDGASRVNTVCVGVQARGCSHWGSVDTLPEPAWESQARCLAKSLGAAGGRRAAHAETVPAGFMTVGDRSHLKTGSPKESVLAPAWRCAGVPGLRWGPLLCEVRWSCRGRECQPPSI